MPNKTTAIGETILEYLDRFPDLESRTLARKLVADHPNLFPNMERARGRIRYYKGVNGRRSRKLLKERRHMKYNLPEPEYEPHEPYILPIGNNRVGVISDTQMPYYDPIALNKACDDLEPRINTLILNGDMFDFYKWSKFNKNPRMRSMADEIVDAQNFLGWIRERFPKCRIIFKEGNHEARWENWLRGVAPELLDTSEFRLDVLLKAGEHGIEWVREKRPIKAGDLVIYHGHELLGVGTVNPSRNLFLKTMQNVLIGHFHKTSDFRIKSIDDKWYEAHTQGCLCGLRPEWMINNQWNHGWSYVEFKEDGSFGVENIAL